MAAEVRELPVCQECLFILLSKLWGFCWCSSHVRCVPWGPVWRWRSCHPKWLQMISAKPYAMHCFRRREVFGQLYVFAIDNLSSSQNYLCLCFVLFCFVWWRRYFGLSPVVCQEPATVVSGESETFQSFHCSHKKKSIILKERSTLKHTECLYRNICDAFSHCGDTVLIGFFIPLRSVQLGAVLRSEGTLLARGWPIIKADIHHFSHYRNHWHTLPGQINTCFMYECIWCTSVVWPSVPLAVLLDWLKCGRSHWH